MASANTPSDASGDGETCLVSINSHGRIVVPATVRRLLGIDESVARLTVHYGDEPVSCLVDVDASGRCTIPAQIRQYCNLPVNRQIRVTVEPVE